MVHTCTRLPGRQSHIINYADNLSLLRLKLCAHNSQENDDAATSGTENQIKMAIVVLVGAIDSGASGGAQQTARGVALKSTETSATQLRRCGK